jgi:hypothetical protein
VVGKMRTSFGDLNGGANGAAFQSGKIVAVGFQATFGGDRWSEFALARYLNAK